MPPARDSSGRFVSGGGNKSVGKVTAYVDSNAVGFNAGIAEAQMRLNTFTATAKRAGLKMTMYLTLPLVLIGRKAAKSFGEFDTAMTESVSIMAGVTEELRAEMEETARTISTKSIKTSAELAKSYYFLASAGLSAEKSIAVLGLVERFATAGAFDMARATDLLTDAQSALGLTVQDTAANTASMARISNVLVKANTLANASVEQFATSLTSKAGTAMRLVNMEVEEGVAVLMAFADQGIKAQLSGNALNIVLRDLQTASRKNADEWERLGIEVYDSSGAMNNMADIIRGLENAIGSMSIEQKTATLSLLGFTDRSKIYTGALIGMSDKIRQYERALRSAGDITETVANEQMKGFVAQSKAITHQINIAFQAIGKRLAPILLVLKKALAAVLNVVSSLPGPLQAILVTVGLLAAALGPMILLLGALARAWAALRTITLLHTVATWALVTAKGALLAVMAALGGPIGIAVAVAGLAAMTIGVTLLVKKITSGVHELAEFNKQIDELSGKTLDVAMPVEDLKDMAKQLGALYELGKEGPAVGDVGAFKALASQLRGMLPDQSALIGKIAQGNIDALGKVLATLRTRESAAIKDQVIIAGQLVQQRSRELDILIKNNSSQAFMVRKMQQLDEASKAHNRLLDISEGKVSDIGKAYWFGAQNAHAILEDVKEIVKLSPEQLALTKHLEDVKFDLRTEGLEKEMEGVRRTYGLMIDEAKKAGLDITALEESRRLKMAALVEQSLKDEATLIADAASQNKQIKIRATMEGVEEELALLFSGYLRDYANASELQKKLIDERYDLERAAIKKRDADRKQMKAGRLEMSAAKARVQFELDGLAEQLTLLELARREEIKRAEAAGLATEAISERYDWMRKGLLRDAKLAEAPTAAGKFAAALQKGSVAAYSAALQTLPDTDEAIEENTRLIVEEEEKSNELLAKISDRLDSPSFGPVIMTMP